MIIKDFYDKATSTLSYVVYDENTKDALVIDPVLDFDPASGEITTESAMKLIHFIENMDLKLHVILETHVHADHMSSSQVIKKRFPQAKITIGEKVCEVQKTFKEILALKDLKTDGSQFDQLIPSQSKFRAGSLEILAIATPGHTPACMSWLIEDALFTGDSIFMPDSGTGRCDFPGGSAEKLYHSIADGIYILANETRIFVGHDYQPGGRALAFETTVGLQKAGNIHLKQGTTKEEFVKFRTERDATLSAPRLLYPSLQVNLVAGRIPEPDSQGRRFLKLPITVAGEAE